MVEHQWRNLNRVLPPHLFPRYIHFAHGFNPTTRSDYSDLSPFCGPFNEIPDLVPISNEVLLDLCFPIDDLIQRTEYSLRTRAIVS